MTLDDLQNLERVKSHLGEVYKAHQIITNQLAAIKEEVKSFDNDMQFGNVICKYSKYSKLRPVNMDIILERYPVASNPNLYNITLNKDAQHIITDESLFEEEEVQLVRFTIQDE